MDSSDRGGRFARRGSFRIGLPFQQAGDMARLLDDEDDGDEMGLFEAAGVPPDQQRQQRRSSLVNSSHDMPAGPDVATEKAARRGSFRFTSSRSADEEESHHDQAARAIFRRGSFRISRRASLDTGCLLGSDPTAEDHDDVATSIPIATAPRVARRASLDMSSFLDSHETTPVASTRTTAPSKSAAGHERSQSADRDECPAECRTAPASPSTKTEDLEESTDKPGPSPTRDRHVRRTKSHTSSKTHREDREMRRAKSIVEGQGEEKSSAPKAPRSPDQASSQRAPPSRKDSGDKRREPVRRSNSSSSSSSRPDKPGQVEVASPRRRPCASRATGPNGESKTHHAASERRSKRDAGRSDERVRSSTKSESNDASLSRRRSKRPEDPRSKPEGSGKPEGQKERPKSAFSKSSSSVERRSRSVSRVRADSSSRSESRSVSRSSRTRGERSVRRDGSDDKDESLAGAILSDKRTKPRSPPTNGYLPSAFATHRDSDNEDDDSNSYDDASECSSSIQLDIHNPALVDHYVSAAVNMCRDFVGADISIGPADDGDELSDDENIDDDMMCNDEVLKGVEAWKATNARGALPFNSVLDHLGFRRRTEGSPAC